MGNGIVKLALWLAGQLALSRRVRVVLLLTDVVGEADGRTVRCGKILPPTDLLHATDFPRRIDRRRMTVVTTDVDMGLFPGRALMEIGVVRHCLTYFLEKVVCCHICDGEGLPIGEGNHLLIFVPSAAGFTHAQPPSSYIVNRDLLRQPPGRKIVKRSNNIIMVYMQ